jgi:hypothetical protein
MEKRDQWGFCMRGIPHYLATRQPASRFGGTFVRAYTISYENGRASVTVHEKKTEQDYIGTTAVESMTIPEGFSFETVIITLTALHKVVGPKLQEILNRG